MLHFKALSSTYANKLRQQHVTGNLHFNGTTNRPIWIQNWFWMTNKMHQWCLSNTCKDKYQYMLHLILIHAKFVCSRVWLNAIARAVDQWSRAIDTAGDTAIGHLAWLVHVTFVWYCTTVAKSRPGEWLPARESTQAKILQKWDFGSLIMVALCNTADHYIFALLFLSSIYLLFFPRLISAAAGWMSTILWHMVWA